MFLITLLSSSEFYPGSLSSPEMSHNHDAFLCVNLISDGRKSLSVLSYLCSVYAFGKVMEAFLSVLLHNRLCAQLNVRLTGDKVEQVLKLYGSNLKWFAAGFDTSLRNVNI